MSTDTAVLMDPVIPDDKGPWFGSLTSNADAGGPVDVKMLRTDVTLTAPGASPQGGIDYIDQAVGGVIGPRGDVFPGPLTSGIAAKRHLTIRGDFLGSNVINPNRVQGNVGRNGARNKTVARAISAQSAASNIPTDSTVVGAFLNPALTTLIAKVKGKSA